MEQEPEENLEAGGQPMCAVAGAMWGARHTEPADSKWLCPPRPCCVTGGSVLKEGKSRHGQ